MRRQGCSPGCAIVVLGALISCFLLPYLASSIYAIARVALDVPGTPEWLWGEWVSGWAGGNQVLYMVLTEGPICCAGILGLMAVVLGVVFATSELEATPDEAIGPAPYTGLPWKDERPWDEVYLDEDLPWDEEDDEEAYWDEGDEEEAYWDEEGDEEAYELDADDWDD